MEKFVKAAKKQDIPQGEGIVADVQGIPIAIFNVGGDFFAVQNTCPHRGGPLGEGDLSGSMVTCPWHGWQFDVCKGINIQNPASRLKCFSVKVEGDDVLVEV
jgi:nitrite reductase/ring-hydroxylating ferredoxin subunit